MPASQVSEESPPAASPAAAPPVKFRYAVKTSLSLTLAYLIPMALGWPQPQTAATTVMLIAATGLLSESLQKGVLRVLGTVAGAILGLGLIALFPQDRMVYLLAVSMTVAFIIYLYNAYQGDSTVFMLTAVVTLMVFNGGDAEGAFLYGVDRAFMTAFGVIVYTVVASMLWPVRTADNTRELAEGVSRDYRQAFDRLVASGEPREASLDAFMAGLLDAEQTFQTQFASAKGSADGVTDYLAEWNCVVSCYEELHAIVIPALKQEASEPVDYARHIGNYGEILHHIDTLFGDIDNAWQGQQRTAPLQALEVQLNRDSLGEGSHLVAAAVFSRAELLHKLQQVLLDLGAAQDSMLFDRGGFTLNRHPRGKATFVWLDLENLKTALRAFVTFWIATAIWMNWNPPGGFMFVTMCTVLIPLVSYTPATPKLLIVLFTLGFLFALPAYIFLLPQMIHWTQLAVFLFGYAFIGFYAFQGPVSIFFLLGLFTLGIQNSMSYHVDAIMLTILMFYMICATLIISVYFPFTSKPERLYASLRRRFFHHCAKWLRHNSMPATLGNRITGILLGSGGSLLDKMHSWGAQVDTAFFTDNGMQHIDALNRSCELLYGQLQVLALRRQEFAVNPLITAARQRSNGHPIAALCENLAQLGPGEPFARLRSNVADIEQRLDELLGDDSPERYDPTQLAEFYVYLNLQVSILTSIEACRRAQLALDWQQLEDTRF